MPAARRSAAAGEDVCLRAALAGLPDCLQDAQQRRAQAFEFVKMALGQAGEAVIRGGCQHELNAAAVDRIGA